MKTESTTLLNAFRAALKRRGMSLHQASLIMGVHYSTIYFNLNPSKRWKKVKGKNPEFTYELGKKMEKFINETK